MNDWDPNPLENEIISSGPFYVSDFEEYESVALRVNPFFPFLPITETSTESTTPTSTEIPYDIPVMAFFSVTITLSSLLIIVVVVYNWKKGPVGWPLTGIKKIVTATYNSFFWNKPYLLIPCFCLKPWVRSKMILGICFVDDLISVSKNTLSISMLFYSRNYIIRY